MNTLISPAKLAQLIDHYSVTVFDCRFSLSDPPAGARAYAQGHVPGAYYVGLDQDLSLPHLPGKTGRHPLPPRNEWIQRALRWGLSPERQVVVYDDSGGAIAARMWWMLQWIGHDKVALLDGGIAAWQKAGGHLTSDVPPQAVPVADRYSALAPLVSQVLTNAIDANLQLLLDARDPARYRGDEEPIDPVAGHIPGARNSPFERNLKADGTFRTEQELAQLFADAGKSLLPVVCYCGSGVTACHNVLAMKHAGFETPVLYAGSWSEWITDASRPVATGALP